MVVLFDNVVYPLTFYKDEHVIGCNSLLTAAYDEEVDVMQLGVPNNPKSPYEGVKHSTVFIIKLFDASNAKAPLDCNNIWLKDCPFDGAFWLMDILLRIYLLQRRHQ